MKHEEYMKLALDLAAKGEGYTSPNPMVGAVVVKDGEIVGKGWHEAVGKPHAEVNAINDAGEAARGATLYVTLEPCNHTGRTPPCTKKILDAGIKRVIIAMPDPNPDVEGGGADCLAKQGLEVESGVCEREAKKQNEFFIKHTLTKRPFVILKCAATLDGRIATRTGDSKWVTCAESRRHVHRIRHAVGAIMVGIGTVKADDPSLTTRLEGMNGVDPIRVILDTNLSISENAKLLHLDSEAETIIVTSESASPQKAEIIRKTGTKIIHAPLENGLINLDALMDQLGSTGISSILVEGGSRVAGSALSSGIVDRINFFYAPKILGGDDGIPMVCGAGPEFMKDCIRVKDASIRKFGDDIMIEGYVPRLIHTECEN